MGTSTAADVDKAGDAAIAQGILRVGLSGTAMTKYLTAEGLDEASTLDTAEADANGGTILDAAGANANAVASRSIIALTIGVVPSGTWRC